MIRKELGEDEENGIEQLQNLIIKARLPGEARQEAERELKRLEHMSTGAAEYIVVNSYLDWITSLPWNKTSRDRLDIHKASKILNEDHEDLEKIKEWIPESLAVRKLKKDSKGPIFCFVGPPGVGKTSLGRSIAKVPGAEVCTHLLGWSARRIGDPWPQEDLYRLTTRPNYSKPAQSRDE